VEDLRPTGQEPGKSKPRFGFRIVVAGIFLLLVLLGTGLFLLLRPSISLPPPVVLLHDNFPKGQPMLFERFVPMKPGWGWAWKLREFIAGRPKRIDLTVTIMDCPEFSGAQLPGLPLEKPSHANTNGLQVWILADSDLDGVTERMKQLMGSRMISRPRISTSSGVGCDMQSDKTTVSILAYAHPERTDLYARFVHTETQSAKTPAFIIPSLEMDLNVSLRIQLPKGNGLLLLNVDPKTQRHTAVSVSLRFPTGK
jgi:hypothetical protein